MKMEPEIDLEEEDDAKPTKKVRFTLKKAAAEAKCEKKGCEDPPAAEGLSLCGKHGSELAEAIKRKAKASLKKPVVEVPDEVCHEAQAPVV